MKKIFLITVILLITSCYSSDEINNNTTFSDIFIKTQKFADDFNSKKIKADDSLPNIYKIEKKYFIEKYNQKTIVFDIEIPFNLREENLKIFMELFASKYIQNENAIEIHAYHSGINKFSKIVCIYYISALNPENNKHKSEYTDNLSKEVLLKNKINHYLLEHDYLLLVTIHKELETKKYSKEQIIDFISKKHKISAKYIANVLTFATSYYKNSFL